MNVKDYTFQMTRTLFDEDVIMVLRNKDKKHIVSIGEDHKQAMLNSDYDPENNEEILTYLKKTNYI